MDNKARFVEVSAFNKYTEYEKHFTIDVEDIHVYYIDNGELIIDKMDLHLPLNKPENQKLYEYLQKITVKLGV